MILTVLLLAVAAHYVSSHGCEIGWEQYRGSCYSFGEELVAWQDASQLCEIYNSYLVEINDAEENQWLVTMLKGKAWGTIWAGATERLHRGTWEWVPSRRPLGKFRDWYGAEPNGAYEDCLGLYGGGYDYKWLDLPCLYTYRFVCEKKRLGTEVETTPKSG